MISNDTIFTLAFRVIQMLLSITVLSLSISLIQGNILGRPPLALTFSADEGGVSIVGALSGLAALWVQMLQGRIGIMVDAAIAEFSIAGGVVSISTLPGNLISRENVQSLAEDVWFIAAKPKGIHCKDVSFLKLDEDTVSMYDLDMYSDIICGGLVQKNGTWECGYLTYDYQQGMLLSRSQISEADSAFMLLTAIVVYVAAVLGYLRMKRGY